MNHIVEDALTAMREAAAEIIRLSEQRDELAAAAKEALSWLESGKDENTLCGEIEATNNLRAALAKVK